MVQLATVQRFVNAVDTCSNKSQENNSKTLKEMEWLTQMEAESMYIRDSFPTLYTLSTELFAFSAVDYQVILSGSYGVGKRTLLNYIVYRLCNSPNRPQIVLDLNEFFGILHINRTVEEGVRGVSFQSQLSKRDTYYICDAVALSTGPLIEGIGAKCIIISPLIKERIERFENKHECISLSIPLWSPEELEACRQVCYPHVSPQESQSLQALWGGLVKWTLATTVKDSHAQFNRSLQSLPLENLAAILDNRGWTRTNTESMEASYLIHVNVEKNNTFQAQSVQLCSSMAVSQLLQAIPDRKVVVELINRYRGTLGMRLFNEKLVEQVLLMTDADSNEHGM